MWLYVAAAIVAGLLQSFLTGWWGDFAYINLPALVVMATMRRWDFSQAIIIAIISGVTWDFINPPVGLTALVMLVVTVVVFYIEQRWWPVRGGIPTAILLMIMVLIIRWLLTVLSGSLTIINWPWFIEALITGIIGGLLWRRIKLVKSDWYGQRSL